MILSTQKILEFNNQRCKSLKRFIGNAAYRIGKQRDIRNFYLASLTRPRQKKDFDTRSIYKHPLIDVSAGVRLADFFSANIRQFETSYSLLNVGTGLNVPPNWLDFFATVLLYDHIGSIEVWKPYIKKWKYHAEFPVWHSDVRNIHNLLPPKSVDTVLWAQGPEHMPLKDILPTYLRIKNIARHQILFVTPWGSAYDHQEEMNDNPYERHQIKSVDERIYEGTNFSFLEWGEINKPNGGLLAYEFLTFEAQNTT